MARGDVIFYRPAGATSIEGLDPANFDQFPVLAAYAQTFPYTPQAFKPWHHVALSVTDDDARVVGFTQEDYQAGGEPPDGRLAETASGPAAGQTLVALRPPPGIREALVQAAQDQVGIAYSAPGLMPFALITAAWMVPSRMPGRRRLRAIAFGSSAKARQADPEAESCTTAVAKAVEKAQGSSLAFDEPPIPVRLDLRLADFLGQSQVQAIRALIPRLDNALRGYFERKLVGRRAGDIVTKLGGSGVVRNDTSVFLERVAFDPDPPYDVQLSSFADHLSLLAPDTTVDWVAVNHTLNLLALHDAALFPDDISPWAGPGFNVTIGTYMAMMRIALQFFDPDADFEALGSSRLADNPPITSDDFLFSPAMLWDALLDAEFKKV